LHHKLELTTNPTEHRMNRSPTQLAHTLLWAMTLLAATLGAASALAAGTGSAAKSEARYQRDAAVCLSSRYVGEKADCLSEASTARASREPVMIDPDPERYTRNAIKRCEPLPESDRIDCIARMQGRGTTTGSIAGGGIYRELVTREVGTAPAAVPAK